jgi:hypothetical protein
MSSIVLFDSDLLKKTAAVDFKNDDLEMLADLAKAFNERDQNLLPSHMLQHARRDVEIRRGFIEVVWDIWSDCRRPRPRRKRDECRRKYRRPRSYQSTKKQFINLVIELFKAIGEKPPAPLTLRHDLNYITARREHQH